MAERLLSSRAQYQVRRVMGYYQLGTSVDATYAKWIIVKNSQFGNAQIEMDDRDVRF